MSLTGLGLVGLATTLTLRDYATTGAPFYFVDDPLDRARAEIDYWFLWDCPHCEQFNEKLDAWALRMGEAVVVNKKPLPLASRRDAQSERIRYAALHSVLADWGISKTLFKALTQAARENEITVEVVDRLLDEQRADREEFWHQYRELGPVMASELMQEATQAGVRLAPTLVVSGLYRIEPSFRVSHDDMLRTATDLIL